MKLKTIDVNAKEWFDKKNGNSYFSAKITINYGNKYSESFIHLPFQYGYGDHYNDMAFQELIKLGLIKNNKERQSYWQYYRDNNIIYRYSKQEDCKKKDL